MIARPQQMPPPDTNQAYTVVQQMPKFNGDIRKYMQDSPRYPQHELDSGIAGTVYVTFVVERNGRITNTRILRGVTNGPGLNKEALRVVSAMPQWIPGTQDGKPVRVQFNLPIHFELNDKPDIVYKDAGIDSLPRFNGNLNKYLNENIHYPDSELKNGIKCTLNVSYVVETDGSISSVKVSDSTHIPKPFINEADRVLTTMPKWTPGLKNGKPVRVENKLAIGFMLNKKVSVSSGSDSVNSGQVFTLVQQMPKFVGNLNDYLSTNIHYPEAERRMNITGTVYITFVIEKDGSVSGVRVLRGVPGGPGLDAEAVRVVSIMPTWIPGTQNGHLVRVQFNLPIHFELRDVPKNSNSIYLH